MDCAVARDEAVQLGPKKPGGIGLAGARKVTPTGREQTQRFPGKTGGGRAGAAQRDANTPPDVALAEWFDACPVALDDETRAGIVAMVTGERCP
jgi:hypothetical protein